MTTKQSSDEVEAEIHSWPLESVTTMDDTTAGSVEHRVATIVEQLNDYNETVDEEGGTYLPITESDIRRNIERLLSFHVPMNEAVRTLVRRMITDAGVDEADLTDGLARLAGYSRQPQPRQFERHMLGDVDSPDEWIDVVAEVVNLWEPRSEKIAQVGLLGDESGRLKFVKWASADLPTLEEGVAYRFRNVVTDEYNGRYSVSLNSVTTISDTDEEVATAGTTVAVSGTIVDVQEGSGLIKRCPHEDCTRVLQGGRCREHGDVDGEFDLRIKAILDDGARSARVLFNREATEAVTGTTLEAAQAMATDALDSSVVLDEFRSALIGRVYHLEGPVVGKYFLVDDAEESDSSGLGLDQKRITPALTQREPARRVFAQEFNAATHTFKQSDEERAPVYGLLPTGEAANRVLVVGTLIDAEDIGSNGSEYWRGRVVAASDTVFVYAGQYQTEAQAVLRNAETPCYVAVVGKIRTYETNNGHMNVSLQPESMAVVDAGARDTWVAETLAQTQSRLEAFENDEAEFGELAREVYGEDVSAIRSAVVDLDEETGSIPASK